VKNAKNPRLKNWDLTIVNGVVKKLGFNCEQGTCKSLSQWFLVLLIPYLSL